MARPKKVGDEALITALLEEVSPSKAAKRLGVHRNTIVARLKDEALRERLRDLREQAAEAAGSALLEHAGEAVKVLVELMRASSPQDSVRQGAAGLLLKLAKDFAAKDAEREERDEVWDQAPKFEQRRREPTSAETPDADGEGSP